MLSTIPRTLFKPSTTIVSRALTTHTMTSHNQSFLAQNLFNVEGWTCVVTGGGTGIGLMIAQAFANNGARVFITGRRKEVIENSAQKWGSALAHPKGAIVPVQCDNNDKKSILELVEAVKRQSKSLDVLVTRPARACESSRLT